MPSSSKKGKPAVRPSPPKKKTVAKPLAPSHKGGSSSRPPSKPVAKSPAKGASRPSTPPKGTGGRPVPSKPTASGTPPPPAIPPLTMSRDARRHVLSLSFLRDGDEFLARLETDAGQITELKNRSLDQLLTLVAGELEDLLE
ncbi:MAG: hypothetical protein L3K08_03790 [Thermoplasmata archaeon]|nr:hypothetical protein [Thermoplasmata archaeon]